MLTSDEIIGKLREKGIKQIDIARKLNEKWLSNVNNTIHRRAINGKKTKKIRSVISELLNLPYDIVWSDN